MGPARLPYRPGNEGAFKRKLEMGADRYGLRCIELWHASPTLEMFADALQESAPHACNSSGLCWSFRNLVFPLRPGELLRCYLVSDSEDISIGRVLGSVGVERLIDLVIATASLAIVSLLVPLPRRFERVADTLGVVTLVYSRSSC